MIDFDKTRYLMVNDQIQARGVQDTKVLQAMRAVRREAFVPEDMRDLSYRDSPLPIGAGQTISQPYIVGYMVEALRLKGGEKVLEIGGGSGYAAAVLAEIASQVYTVERIDELAEKAAKSLSQEGYDNVNVMSGDGTTGWKEFAPFDAILVSAGAPSIPESLKYQLTLGGCMVVPVGSHKNIQELVRITRQTQDQFDFEKLADVRFVPLIGEQGWEIETNSAHQVPPRVIQTRPIVNQSLPNLILQNSEPFQSPEEANLDNLLARIGDAKVVLIGEASHGTSEFYSMRARITQRLIEEKGFTIVAAEADWPDAAQIDHYVRHRDTSPAEWTAFSRFPTWMWRNIETRDFIDWLHEYNKTLPSQDRTGFYGLDMYSLFTSINAVVEYLEKLDPDLAEVARWRYGCLSPWEADPAAYGKAALRDQYQDCENDVAQMLTELYQKRQSFLLNDGGRFLDAAQNAELIANAERYYRVMYYGSRASWNLRDQHMFDTLNRVMQAKGYGAKAVVWAHNSHIGDASATEMSKRGEHNIGQLCRQAFGEDSYRIGFGTDHGTVAAASNWDQPMEIKQVQPSHPQSYENVFHQTQQSGLILPLRDNNPQLIQELNKPKLERAIGVIYRPETELASHYFEAVLPLQFDEYIWIDQTRAVTPLTTEEISGMPDTYPFGL
ncbi:protein-L-isoaspartate(D-aspartate) O-methyltransferase [Hydrogenovibrio sp. 3SP14C1]|uniref:protein-L-isoaspartate(D-aspartate) O-methyltransferase n=1 Tax=Hydrogenovibrio sp. 3SP14C1 TaxID=3038774 RepID=UPI002415C590|nr:protein-L-isoaspartate(D-aspartate) O-methyltransferase [Hydrogenovibrio sp. 3SP14C1]MDG4812534.1 protein-L-isoaspartate(D-aspartate) O-methyltransferase [Hydrogenovibrio sp. 3SP14C1]